MFLKQEYIHMKLIAEYSTLVKKFYSIQMKISKQTNFSNIRSRIRIRKLIGDTTTDIHSFEQITFNSLIHVTFFLQTLQNSCISVVSEAKESGKHVDLIEDNESNRKVLFGTCHPSIYKYSDKISILVSATLQ